MVKAPHEFLPELTRGNLRRREPRAHPLAEARARVMVVIEDRLAGKRLARMLTADGYDEVRVVRRAASALFLARQSQPDVIFLDIALSDDAYQLASDLRRLAGRSALRLIALTSSIEHSTREHARDAGFERWLVTPVAQNELDGLMCNENAASS